MKSTYSWLWFAFGVALIVGLVLLLYRPTLHDGLFADDYVAMSIIDGQFAGRRSQLDLFNFADGSISDVQALRRLGSLPWWAPTDYRISFMRPLSSALWHVDRALFGTRYGLYHAHSLVVFAALIAAAAYLYRRLFTPLVAIAAALIFAVDDSHHFPVVWLSNRGGIYAVLIGVLALSAHIRFRTDGQRAYLALSMLLTTIGLLFGEWAVPMLAYLAAYELMVVTAPTKKRLLALATHIVPVLIFLVVRGALHYGARGSGAYIDPGLEPVRFILAVCQRLPVFFADMVWNVPSEWWDQGSPWRDELLRMWIIPPSIWMLLPDWHFYHVLLGLLALAGIGCALRFCRAGLSEREWKHLCFLCLGSLGALVPVVGSFPSTRLTIAAFWGLAPLFALVVREIARRLAALPGQLKPRVAGAFVAYALIVGAIFHMQLYTPLQFNPQAQVDQYATTSQWALAAELDPSRLPEQRVFLLAGSEFTTTFFFSYIWSYHGKPLPRSYYPLSASPLSMYLVRTAPNQLLLRTLGGSFFASGGESMFHSPQRVWKEGETVFLDGLRVNVERVVDGLPGVLRLTFARAVDDTSYEFLFAAPFGLIRMQLPAEGQQILLPRAADPSWHELERHRHLARIAPIPDALFYGSYPGFMLYQPPQ
jgi:hypothetical protein